LLPTAILLAVLARQTFVTKTQPPPTCAPTARRGDGETDDTLAIQKAVDIGGAVRFGKGVFRLTKRW